MTADLQSMLGVAAVIFSIAGGMALLLWVLTK